MRIDIFVYDLLEPAIPSGVEAPLIVESFQAAIADLRQAEAKRLYGQLSIGEAGQRALGERRFLHVHFSYVESLKPKEGELLVAGVNSQIIKIRSARRRNAALSFQEAYDGLAAAISRSRS